MYGVVSKRFEVRRERDAPFSQVMVTVGLGNDRFLPESKFQRREKGVNAFGSVGVRVWSYLNIVADWTGQDLNVGLSLTPLPRTPLVIVPALVDVTGNAGDKMRFSVGAVVTYDFHR